MENQSANEYRLQHISEIRKIIQDERRKRVDLSKRYKKSVRIIAGVDDALAAFTMVLGSIGIALLASAVVTSPVIIAIEATALTAGVLRVIGDQVNKRLSKQVEKHEKIKLLAESTLSTISRYISKALNDGQISDEEYSLILSELDKFRELKENIRTKVKGNTPKRSWRFRPLFKKPSK